MRRAFVQLYGLRARNLQSSRDPAIYIKSAIFTYATALTLHPYEDGNGRSFRLLFASDVAIFPKGQASYWMLILAVLRYVFADQFHLAIKIFRLGDVDMLFDLIRAAQKLTATIFPWDDALSREEDASNYFLERYDVFFCRAISGRL